MKRILHGDMFLVAAHFAVTSLVIIVCKANVYMLYMNILLFFYWKKGEYIKKKENKTKTYK